MTAGDFSNLAAWLAKQIAGIKFGEASIRVVIHDGRTRVEKCVIVKEQPESGE